MDGLELADSELLGNPADLEVNEIGGREIDLDGVDVKPEEKSADLDALEVLDAAVLDDAADPGLVVDLVFELHVAGALQLHHEAAVLSELEGLHRVRQEPRRQAVLRQQLVHRRPVRRRRRRRLKRGGAAAGEKKEEEGGEGREESDPIKKGKRIANRRFEP